MGCIDAGASGYLDKTVPMTEIIEGIVAAAGGRRVLSDELRDAYMDARQAAERRSEGLSMRERQYVELIAAGLTEPEIADRLQLGRETIKSFRKRAYEKLGAHRRSEAIAEARRLGLLA